MRRFAALYRELDRSTATLDKRAALVAYFRDAGTVGMYFPVDPRDLPQLRAWIAERGVDLALIHIYIRRQRQMCI